MKRFNRVIAILIQLQSKKIVKAKDIADRFKISIRTVYRDIQTLEEAGVPIASESGIGYSLMDGYRLPPVMFTNTEAIAFITAEKLIEKFTDKSIDVNYKSAMLKIRAVLRNSEKDYLENIEENIVVLRNQSFLQNIIKSDKLKSIIESISEKKALLIKYLSFYSNETNNRVIEPIGIFFSNSYWHIIAFCNLRNDYRDFRVDRILEIEKTDFDFQRIHPSVKEYLSRLKKEQNLETVVILVDNSIVHYLKEQKYYYGFISEKNLGNMTEMIFLISNIEYFLRWYIVFADNAEIITPDSLKNSLKEIIIKLNEKYL